MDLVNVLLQEAVNFQLVRAGDVAVTNGNFPASTAYIGVSGYHRFGFLIWAGALDSAITAQVKQDTDETETAGIKNVTGATVTISATDDNKFAIIEVDTARLDINNGYRYVTLAISGAAGDNDYVGIMFFGVGKNVPISNGSTQVSSGLVSVVG